MIDEIKDKLTSQINSKYLDVIDESPKHGGYTGAVSHIKIIIVSKELKKMSKIESNKKIYKILDHELKKFIHSIQILIN